MKKSWTILCTLGALQACGDDEPVPNPALATIEIIGAWDSELGGDESVTATRWLDSDIVAYDNAENYAILRADADAMFNPGKYSKVVWTPVALDGFYYCTVDFGLDGEAAAKATSKTADAREPRAGGCGGFPWTRVFPPIEVRGRYTSNFGGMETITSTAWAGTPIRKFDNTRNYAVTQNPADAMFGPNRFNKIVWTEKSGGSFHYCFVDFGRETLAQAETSTQTADDAKPDEEGCGGFAWTKLSAE